MYKIEDNKIIFDYDYNKTTFCEIIEIYNMTNDVKIDEIKFGEFFNQDIYLLPPYIKKIEFHWHSRFDHQLDFLPKSLTHLKLGPNFNMPLDNLPEGLTHLELGPYFNIELERLPESLTYLDLGHCFNQALCKLPDSLINLTIGTHYNHYIHQLKSIPPNCKIVRK